MIPKPANHSDIQLDDTQTPPHTYIELKIDHLPIIKEVVIGPKAERKEEWAAAFKVRLSQVNKEKDIPVKISTLPFK
ncbi:MAG: hypothetical protein HOO88_06610 [Kiritimatiellaceae bacterium]|nr:hypothetical protein [Kiritimatiellaceae bacterium]